MNADAAFITGKTHRVCQDYARADSKNGEYVIVSDGCSSSPDSDFGARLLVKSIENAIRDPKSVDPLGEMQWTRPATLPPFNGIAAARAACKTLQLNDQALDATLLVARIQETKFRSSVDEGQGLDWQCSKAIHVIFHGDGVCAGLKNDGIVEAYHVEFPTGYPQYLNYRLDQQRQALIAAMENKNAPVITRWTKQPDREVWDKTTGSRFDSGTDWDLFVFPIDQFKLVSIFSDGISSFTDASGSVVPWQTIVQMMMEVPLPQGEFIQRQVNWLVKESAKRKWANQDDFAMGAINL